MTHLTHHFAGLKLAAMTGTLGIFALESVADQPDMLRYAVTQGGLLTAFLVLLYFYRKDFQSDRDRASDRITVLTDLVQRASEAHTKSADAQMVQARAIEELTRTIGHMSGRA